MSETTEPAAEPEAADAVVSPPSQSETSPGDELFANEPAPEKPDLSEQIQLLQQSVEKLHSASDEVEGDDDGYEFAQDLMETEPDPYYQPPQHLQEQYAQYEPEPHPLIQKVEAMEQYLAQQAEHQRMQSLGELVQELPELKDEEMQAKIGAALEGVAERYGNEALLDPGLLRLTYRAIKAEAASANEVPAEEARNRGASLETNAGARAGSDELDESEMAADAIVKAGPNRSVFG